MSTKKADMDGNYMSVKAVRALAEHAEMLMQYITEEAELPDWVEAKITRANSDLTDVVEHYLHQPRMVQSTTKFTDLSDEALFNHFSFIMKLMGDIAHQGRMLGWDAPTLENKLSAATEEMERLRLELQERQRQKTAASLRAKVIRLASANPSLRPHLLPLLQGGS